MNISSYYIKELKGCLKTFQHLDIVKYKDIIYMGLPNKLIYDKEYNKIYQTTNFIQEYEGNRKIIKIGYFDYIIYMKDIKIENLKITDLNKEEETERYIIFKLLIEDQYKIENEYNNEFEEKNKKYFSYMINDHIVLSNSEAILYPITKAEPKLLQIKDFDLNIKKYKIKHFDKYYYHQRKKLYEKTDEDIIKVY